MNLRLFSFCFFVFAFVILQKTNAQDFINLEGKILAADTKEPIPFASIGIPEKGIGNICNEAGAFELKIPVADKNAKVCISALGFKEVCLPASGFRSKNNTIFLEPANLQIATVEIKAISAESLVKEAIKRIPENYADKPVLYTYYHRQFSITNDKPVYIIESIDEAFQNHPKKDFQCRILKSRGIATSKENQEKMDNTWVQVNAILSYTDVARYRPFLHPSKYKNYIYNFEKEDLIGKDTVLVIAFKPKIKSNGKEVPGSEGKLFMHHRSKAIIRVECKDNQAALDKDNNSLLIQAANKIEKGVLEFTNEKDVFEYKQIGNRWYLNHVYREYSSQFTLIENPVPERHLGITQLVVSNMQSENAAEIPEEHRAKKFANFYSTAPKDMNEAYWQQYNVIPLPEAYKTQTAQ